MDNPIAISGSGSEVAGGLAGSTYTWLVNLDQVYVCENGASVQTGFPNGLFNKLAEGAEFGRCEHQGGTTPLPAPVQSTESFETGPSGAAPLVQFERPD